MSKRPRQTIDKKPVLTHHLKKDDQGNISVILHEAYLFTVTYPSVEEAQTILTASQEPGKLPPGVVIRVKEKNVGVWVSFNVTELVIPQETMDRYKLDVLQFPMVAAQAMTKHINMMINSREYQDTIDKKLIELRNSMPKAFKP